MGLASSTRGVSFDPAIAAKERARQQEAEARKRAEVDRLRLRAQSHSQKCVCDECSASMSPMKRQALLLDQVEKSYRQHTPAQNRKGA